MLARGRVRKIESLGSTYVHSAIFKTDNQQRSINIAYETLVTVVWQPGWEREFEENEYMYMYSSVHFSCPPGTITTLLISYSPI